MIFFKMEDIGSVSFSYLSNIIIFTEESSSLMFEVSVNKNTLIRKKRKRKKGEEEKQFSFSLIEFLRNSPRRKYSIGRSHNTDTKVLFVVEHKRTLNGSSLRSKGKKEGSIRRGSEYF